MRLAFYRAAAGDRWDRFIGWWTRSPFSHVELVSDNGLCYSSSPRDGGVRAKAIAFDPAKWVFVDLPPAPDPAALPRLFGDTAGCGYDWAGVVLEQGFGLWAWLTPQVGVRRYYCSEWVYAALHDMGYGWAVFRPIPPSPGELFIATSSLAALAASP